MLSLHSELIEPAQINESRNNFRKSFSVTNNDKENRKVTIFTSNTPTHEANQGIQLISAKNMNMPKKKLF